MKTSPLRLSEYYSQVWQHISTWNTMMLTYVVQYHYCHPDHIIIVSSSLIFTFLISIFRKALLGYVIARLLPVSPKGKYSRSKQTCQPATRPTSQAKRGPEGLWSDTNWIQAGRAGYSCSWSTLVNDLFVKCKFGLLLNFKKSSDDSF